MRENFEKLKNDILGKNYSLSIAYVSEKKSREINRTYRNKDNPTNILSFPLRKDAGEILLCLSVIKKEIKKNKKVWNKNFSEFLQFLVIHGMLHLKGMEHGSIMEEAETKYDQKYNSRNRRGVLDDEGHSGRIPKRRKKS